MVRYLCLYYLKAMKCVHDSRCLEYSPCVECCFRVLQVVVTTAAAEGKVVKWVFRVFSKVAVFGWCVTENLYTADTVVCVCGVSKKLSSCQSWLGKCVFGVFTKNLSRVLWLSSVCPTFPNPHSPSLNPPFSSS